MAAFLGELEKIAAEMGLWDNIHAKRRRIAAGSGERMRRPGSSGAPTPQALRDSQEKRAEVGYRGRKLPGYNKPIASDREGKKKISANYWARKELW